MGKTGEGSGKLGKVEEDWERLGRTGRIMEDLGRLEYLERLGKIGEDWGILRTIGEGGKIGEDCERLWKTVEDGGLWNIGKDLLDCGRLGKNWEDWKIGKTGEYWGRCNTNSISRGRRNTHGHIPVAVTTELVATCDRPDTYFPLPCAQFILQQ